mmetsp:Transcript_9895/g.18986  ORF Transcript_9895/g.18986 Transcript_9895/m.18986 type:complete len:470 (+) Transcript_9895:56-1465(+)
MADPSPSTEMTPGTSRCKKGVLRLIAVGILMLFGQLLVWRPPSNQGEEAAGEIAGVAVKMVRKETATMKQVGNNIQQKTPHAHDVRDDFKQKTRADDVREDFKKQKTHADDHLPEDFKQTTRAPELREDDKQKTRAPDPRGESKQETNRTPDLREDFNFCTTDHLGKGEPMAIDGQSIEYQCAGPHYDNFTAQMHELIQHSSEWKNPSPKPNTWGHRTYSIPANKTVLFLGNSHTRQLALSVACQMPGPTEVYRYDYDMIEKGMAVRYRFSNGATLYAVTNTYAVYTTDWLAALEKQIEMRISDFDVIVQGVFNVPKGKSSFFNNLMLIAKEVPYTFDLDKRPAGPDPSDVMKVFKGPYLLVSQFSINQKSLFEDYRTMVEKMSQKKNAFPMESINARQYTLKMHHEGASVIRTEVKDVGVDIPGLNRLHKCVGQKGGLPDLVAWDVSEFFYRRAFGADQSTALDSREE